MKEYKKWRKKKVKMWKEWENVKKIVVVVFIIMFLFYIKFKLVYTSDFFQSQVGKNIFKEDFRTNIFKAILGKKGG